MAIISPVVTPSCCCISCGNASRRGWAKFLRNVLQNDGMGGASGDAKIGSARTQIRMIPKAWGSQDPAGSLIAAPSTLTSTSCQEYLGLGPGFILSVGVVKPALLPNEKKVSI